MFLLNLLNLKITCLNPYNIHLTRDKQLTVKINFECYIEIVEDNQIPRISGIF